ncbi:MAG: hypothetical protein P8J87_10275, partial [Verrucomicrobiales bacterium]|nr:hypothetical protein [Verrucomicrobiales bacterium]
GIIYIRALLVGTGVTAKNNDVLYCFVPGEGLKLVVREGEAFAGSEGAVADVITSYSANGFGNLAFTVDLRIGTAGITFESSEGIWIYGGTGPSELLMRAGGEIEMEPGDTRTVLSVDIPMRVDGGTGGRPSGISDYNIAVTIEFTPKGSAGAETGIFILGACPPHPPGF